MNIFKRKFPLKVRTTKLQVQVLLKTGETKIIEVRDGIRLVNNDIELTDCSYIFFSIFNKAKNFQQMLFTKEGEFISVDSIDKILSKKNISEERVFDLKKSLFGNLSWI